MKLDRLALLSYILSVGMGTLRQIARIQHSAAITAPRVVNGNVRICKTWQPVLLRWNKFSLKMVNMSLHQPIGWWGLVNPSEQPITINIIKCIELTNLGGQRSYCRLCWFSHDFCRMLIPVIRQDGPTYISGSWLLTFSQMILHVGSRSKPFD